MPTPRGTDLQKCFEPGQILDVDQLPQIPFNICIKIKGEGILAEHKEALERRYALKAGGVSVDRVAERVAQIMDMPVARVWAPGKQRERVRARSLLCCWAVRELGESMAAMAKRLGISAVAVGDAVQRGEKIIAQEGLKLVS